MLSQALYEIPEDSNQTIISEDDHDDQNINATTLIFNDNVVDKLNDISHLGTSLKKSPAIPSLDLQKPLRYTRLKWTNAELPKINDLSFSNTPSSSNQQMHYISSSNQSITQTYSSESSNPTDIPYKNSLECQSFDEIQCQSFTVPVSIQLSHCQPAPSNSISLVHPSSYSNTCQSKNKELLRWINYPLGSDDSLTKQLKNKLENYFRELETSSFIDTGISSRLSDKEHFIDTGRLSLSSEFHKETGESLNLAQSFRKKSHSTNTFQIRLPSTEVGGIATTPNDVTETMRANHSSRQSSSEISSLPRTMRANHLSRQSSSEISRLSCNSEFSILGFLKSNYGASPFMSSDISLATRTPVALFDSPVDVEDDREDNDKTGSASRFIAVQEHRLKRIARQIAFLRAQLSEQLQTSIDNNKPVNSTTNKEAEEMNEMLDSTKSSTNIISVPAKLSSYTKKCRSSLDSTILLVSATNSDLGSDPHQNMESIFPHDDAKKRSASTVRVNGPNSIGISFDPEMNNTDVLHESMIEAAVQCVNLESPCSPDLPPGSPEYYCIASNYRSSARSQDEQLSSRDCEVDTESNPLTDRLKIAWYKSFDSCDIPLLNKRRSMSHETESEKLRFADQESISELDSEEMLQLSGGSVDSDSIKVKSVSINDLCDANYSTPQPLKSCVKYAGNIENLSPFKQPLKGSQCQRRRRSPVAKGYRSHEEKRDGEKRDGEKPDGEGTFSQCRDPFEDSYQQFRVIQVDHIIEGSQIDNVVVKCVTNHNSILSALREVDTVGDDGGYGRARYIRVEKPPELDLICQKTSSEGAAFVFHIESNVVRSVPEKQFGVSAVSVTRESTTAKPGKNTEQPSNAVPTVEADVPLGLSVGSDASGVSNNRSDESKTGSVNPHITQTAVLNVVKPPYVNSEVNLNAPQGNGRLETAYQNHPTAESYNSNRGPNFTFSSTAFPTSPIASVKQSTGDSSQGGCQPISNAANPNPSLAVVERNEDAKENQQNLESVGVSVDACNLCTFKHHNGLPSTHEVLAVVPNKRYNDFRAIYPGAFIYCAGSPPNQYDCGSRSKRHKFRTSRIIRKSRRNNVNSLSWSDTIPESGLVPKRRCSYQSKVKLYDTSTSSIQSEVSGKQLFPRCSYRVEPRNDYETSETSRSEQCLPLKDRRSMRINKNLITEDPKNPRSRFKQKEAFSHSHSDQTSEVVDIRSIARFPQSSMGPLQLMIFNKNRIAGRKNRAFKIKCDCKDSVQVKRNKQAYIDFNERQNQFHHRIKRRRRLPRKIVIANNNNITNSGSENKGLNIYIERFQVKTHSLEVKDLNWPEPIGVTVSIPPNGLSMTKRSGEKKIMKNDEETVSSESQELRNKQREDQTRKGSIKRVTVRNLQAGITELKKCPNDEMNYRDYSVEQTININQNNMTNKKSKYKDETAIGSPITTIINDRFVPVDDKAVPINGKRSENAPGTTTVTKIRVTPSYKLWSPDEQQAASSDPEKVKSCHAMSPERDILTIPIPAVPDYEISGDPLFTFQTDKEKAVRFIGPSNPRFRGTKTSLSSSQSIIDVAETPQPLKQMGISEVLIAPDIPNSNDNVGFLTPRFPTLTHIKHPSSSSIITSPKQPASLDPRRLNSFSVQHPLYSTPQWNKANSTVLLPNVARTVFPQPSLYYSTLFNICSPPSTLLPTTFKRSPLAPRIPIFTQLPISSVHATSNTFPFNYCAPSSTTHDATFQTPKDSLFPVLPKQRSEIVYHLDPSASSSHNSSLPNRVPVFRQTSEPFRVQVAPQRYRSDLSRSDIHSNGKTFVRTETPSKMISSLQSPALQFHDNHILTEITPAYSIVQPPLETVSINNSIQQQPTTLKRPQIPESIRRNEIAEHYSSVTVLPQTSFEITIEISTQLR